MSAGRGPAPGSAPGSVSTGPSDDAPSKKLVLVGMMGSGKTTVGNLLAKRLGVELRDSDAIVEVRTGRTVAQIFADEGEDAFRAHESQALAEMLDDPGAAVVAAAGGAVLDPGTRQRMREAGIVVWLKADPSVLAARTRAGTHRPLLDVDPEGTLARLADERDDLYREVADVMVDVGETDPEGVVETILAEVRAGEGRP